MQFPDRRDLIWQHRTFIDQALRRHDLDFARMSYQKWVESIRQQNENEGGAHEAELEAAKREFSEFVRMDPLYQVILDRLLPLIKERPGILQTELYAAFRDAPKATLGYVLYFAADHGRISRVKSGRTYALTTA